MYCRNCGSEISDKAVMCVNCGVPPLSGNKYCPNCRAETAPEAIVCVKCGVSLARQNNCCQTPDPEAKDWLTTLLLCIFLGGLGIHRFYTGHTVIGIIQLLTGGGCGIWWIIDLITIVVGSFKDAKGHLLARKTC